jgi:glycosyltransferase involved in cell wall biosynthesis
MARVLYLTPVPPYPFVKNGGGQRTRLLYEAMHRMGHDVRTLCILPRNLYDTPSGDAGIVESIEIDDVNVASSSLPGPLGRWAMLVTRYRQRYAPDEAAATLVRRHAADFQADLIVCRYGWLWAKANLGSVLNMSTVLDFDDVDWLALQSRHAADPWPGLGGKIGMGIAERAAKRALLPKVKRANVVLATCDDDATSLAGEGVVSHLVPNVAADMEAPDLVPEPLPPPGNSQRVLFVGDLRHRPNLDGLIRFVDNIWPRIREKAADTSLRIVGRGLEDDLRQQWSSIEGVHVAGFVDDLRAEYAAAALSITPSWWGGGTKIKVAEAAAMGRAQVVTPTALRGFNLLEEAGVLVEDKDEEFAVAVLRLLEDRGLCETLAADAVAARNAFTFPALRDALGDALAAAGR